MRIPMASNTLDDVARKAMDKEIVKAKVTKYSEIFAISMLEKHRRFCRCGLTHLDATPTFKNRPNTYDARCTLMVSVVCNIEEPL